MITIQNGLWVVGLIVIFYIVVRLFIYGAVRSFFEARLSYYMKLKNKIKKGEKL
jgi:F0F1-type ATP synthase membrane subunit b/b'